MGIFWGRDKGNESTPTPELVPASAGATFGPWATHEARCRCTVCK